MSAQPVRSVDRRFTTTAFTYPGYHIAASHGVVRGQAGKAVLGAFASLAGGESSTYIEMAEKARERAFLRMLEHAAAAGGNAVIGVQFTGVKSYLTRIFRLNASNGASISRIALNMLVYSHFDRMTEVMSYGTAVTLVPLQQAQPQPQPQAPVSPHPSMYGVQAFTQPGTPYSQPGTPFSQPTSPYSQPVAQQQQPMVQQQQSFTTTTAPGQQYSPAPGQQPLYATPAPGQQPLYGAPAPGQQQQYVSAPGQQQPYASPVPPSKN
ncbi:hypothetical protein BGZ99_006774 [Dissophora globulifera]|uniref:Uncharacterized protein n=1 Tax=Dissophora globulifera TaxID=979702 RepID=A0A9P6RG56_9FUNG|nr:hypothetical protein BGZ99_006774 [Dissophora globulifera]